MKNGSLASRTKPAILRTRKRKHSENEDDRQVKQPRVDPTEMVSAVAHRYICGMEMLAYLLGLEFRNGIKIMKHDRTFMSKFVSDV